jgi:hypothetical protein
MARQAKAAAVEKGPFEGPPGDARYDRETIPVVDVRLSPDRRLAFRLPQAKARWQGDFADLGAMSAVLLEAIAPPIRINFVVEPEPKPA